MAELFVIFVQISHEAYASDEQHDELAVLGPVRDARRRPPGHWGPKTWGRHDALYASDAVYEQTVFW